MGISPDSYFRFRKINVLFNKKTRSVNTTGLLFKLWIILAAAFLDHITTWVKSASGGNVLCAGDFAF
jgi:hypothetical protein